MTGKSKAKKNVAVLLCVALALACAASLVFVAAAADHDCGGEHCRVCDRVALCAAFVRAAFCAIAVSFFAAVCCALGSTVRRVASRAPLCAAASRGIRLIN